MSSLSLERVTSALQQSKPIAFLEAGRGLVDTLSLDDRRLLTESLRGEGDLGRTLKALPNAEGLGGRLQQMLHFLTVAGDMPPDVEREGRQLAVADMKSLPPTSLSCATMRNLDLTKKGWPLSAQFIELDGLFEPDPSDHPMVYFVHEGAARIFMRDRSENLTKSAQAALPGNTTYGIEGKALLYALQCQPEIGGELVLEHFDDDRKKNDCPCGWSYRIPLVKDGWGFSTHRTVMSGVHDAEHDGFAGHQHKRTHEIYFTDQVEDPASTITVDGVPVPLAPGMLVAIPNGTMHAVDSKGKIVQHIFVGKGHKSDDFWTAGWRPLPR